MLDSIVTREIFRAQYFSDCGKGKEILKPVFRSDRNKLDPYSYKDICIMNAIKLINAKKSAWRFSVTDGGITPYLVYFTLRLNGKRYQVSFHSFNSNLRKYMVKSHETTWDEKCSRATIEYLYKCCQ